MHVQSLSPTLLLTPTFGWCLSFLFKNDRHYYQFGRRIRSSETFTVRSWSFKIVVTLHMDAWIFKIGRAHV